MGIRRRKRKKKNYKSMRIVQLKRTTLMFNYFTLVAFHKKNYRYFIDILLSIISPYNIFLLILYDSYYYSIFYLIYFIICDIIILYTNVTIY